MEGNLVTLDIGNSWIVIIKACKQKQSFDRHVDTRSAPITVSERGNHITNECCSQSYV